MREISVQETLDVSGGVASSVIVAGMKYTARVAMSAIATYGYVKTSEIDADVAKAKIEADKLKAASDSAKSSGQNASDTAKPPGISSSQSSGGGMLKIGGIDNLGVPVNTSL